MISRYDRSITKPPYLTIKIDSMLINKPKNDDLGELFYELLKRECTERGYKFKYYTLPEDTEFDYEVIVH
jgi:hypothetical protein